MRLHSQGVSKSAIARRFDRRFSTITSVIRRGGTVKPPAPDAALRAAITAGGTNVNTLANAHGCHRCVVKRVMAEMEREGIFLPPKGDKFTARTKHLATSIYRLKAEGSGRTEICAALQISIGAYRNAIAYAIATAGDYQAREILSRPNRGPAVTRSDTAKARVIELLKAGNTVAHVVAEAKVGARWVRKVRRAAGLATVTPSPQAWRYQPAPEGARFESVEEFMARGGAVKKCPTPYVSGAIVAPAKAPVVYADDHPYFKGHRGNHLKRLRAMAAAMKKMKT